MQPILRLLAFIIIGLALGYLAYALFLSAPPAQPPQTTNVTQPPPNTTNVTKTPVNLTVIPAPGCPKCVSAQDMLDGMVGVINQSSVLSIGSEKTLDSSSPEAKMLIAKYKITRLPAIIVSGGASDRTLATEWNASIGTIESDGSLVSRDLLPPYYDVQASRIVGMVEGIAINPSDCDECTDASEFFLSLTNAGMAFSNTTVLDENDTQAQELIVRYNLTRLPALLLGPEVFAYPSFSGAKTVGSIESDGWFVLRQIRPPYVDLSQNHSVRGFVDAINIVNSSCTDCLDINTLTNYFATQLGMLIINTTTHDINSTEGMALIKKYNITQVPTVLYSPELDTYPGFRDLWLEQNNTVESDGWFVFRAYAASGYKYQNVSG